jgi:hypothetical protein
MPALLSVHHSAGLERFEFPNIEAARDVYRQMLDELLTADYVLDGPFGGPDSTVSRLLSSADSEEFYTLALSDTDKMERTFEALMDFADTGVENVAAAAAVMAAVANLGWPVLARDPFARALEHFGSAEALDVVTTSQDEDGAFSAEAYLREAEWLPTPAHAVVCTALLAHDLGRDGKFAVLADLHQAFAAALTPPEEELDTSDEQADEAA